MTFLAGQIPTAAELNAIVTRRFIAKAAAESVTSSTVLQDDNDLQVALTNGTYLIDARIVASAAEAGDLKLAWTHSGPCTGPAEATTDRQSTLMLRQAASETTVIPYGIDGSGTTYVGEELYVIVTAAGTLKLQWAQNTSSATATTLTTSTTLFSEKVA
ncbi:MAG: hypothetical protein ACOYBY_17740 [Dermatophilaceae bacterium]